jgi:hypothetical protein
MLKHLCAACAILLVASGAVQAEVQVNGFMKVTARNAACTKGPKLGTVYTAKYHPGVVSGAIQVWNGSGISTFGDFEARSWRKSSGMFPVGSWVTVSNTVLKAKLQSAAKTSRVKITSSTPATISVSTETVRLKGQIRNPIGLAGQENCVIDFALNGSVIDD